MSQAICIRTISPHFYAPFAGRERRRRLRGRVILLLRRGRRQVNRLLLQRGSLAASQGRARARQRRGPVGKAFLNELRREF